MRRYLFTRILSILLILIPLPQFLPSSLPGMTNPARLPGFSTGIHQQSTLKKIYLPMVSKVGSAYFVSNQGSDSNPGTLASPWKTIKKAANSVKPGDLVYIRGGTYSEYVTVSRSGTQAQPIQFLAYPGDPSPVIDGKNVLPNTTDGLLTLDGDWIQVSGLEVTNSTYIGIASYGKHNTLSNVYVHHSSRTGVYLSGDYGTLQNSRVWRNSMHNENGVDTGSSGISASRDPDNGITDYPMIRNNLVWENWGQGINVHHANYATIEGNITYDNYTANIYIHDLTNVLCQRNLVYMTPNNTYMQDLGPEVGIMMGEEYSPPIAENIQVINNIAFGNHRNLFWYNGDYGGGMTNVVFANNTFVNGSGSRSGGNCNVILNPSTNVNVRFINNIVYQQGNSLPVIGTEASANISFSHNLWSAAPVGAASGAGDIIGDPMLAQTGQPYAVDWFKLKPTSPAINKAVSLPEVLDDYLAHARGSAPDLGAVEYIP